MRWLSTLCLLAAGSALFAAEEKKPAGEKTSAKVQVIGLFLRKAPPAKPGAFVFTPNGVTMDLTIAQPEKFIVGIDGKASKLESFTDDKKNDLVKKAPALFGGQANWLSEYATQFSPDGDHCTIQITAASAPGTGAEKILVKGSLVLRCGAEEKTTDKKEIALKMNEEASAGDFKVKVNNTGDFGAGLTVLSAEPRVKSVEFFDPEGKAIKTMPSGRSTNPVAPGGKPQAIVAYFLSGKKLDKVSFKINYFDKIESVTVPLELRVGLDLE
jgi:hypothetical protein